jgi:hypothetical protein
MLAVTLRAMARDIDATPDEALRDAWLATEHGTALYYLALAALTGERAYSGARLVSDRADYERCRADGCGADGCTMADMAWIDARRGK